MSDSFSCFRCVTPTKCAQYGCCPGTWPAEPRADPFERRMALARLCDRKVRPTDSGFNSMDLIDAMFRDGAGS